MPTQKASEEPLEYQAEPPRKYLQEEFLENISEEIRLDGHYLILLTFSTIIAVLGLITNSAAVVIGAMLIAPLFWPILGLTLSIITNRQRLMRRSTINLIVSIGLVLLIGYIVATLSPFSQVTTEISSRTNPTLLDLFIALSASVVGVLAIYHPRVSQSASGVAISVALLPPLCVSGIGIAFKSWEIFLNSFLLFATNIGAIIFVGAVTLYLLKFRPQDREDTQRMKLGFTASFFFLAIISIPLSYFLIQSINRNRIASHINTNLPEIMANHVENSRIESVDINFPTSFQKKSILVKATVLVPEGTSITVGQQSEIIDELTQSAEGEVDLELNLLNTLVLRREEDEILRQLRQDIRTEIIKDLATGNSPITFESLEINFPPEKSQDPTQITLVLRETYLKEISYNDKIRLESSLRSKFERDIEIDVQFIPIRNLSEQTELQQLESNIVRIVNQYLEDISPDLRFTDYKLDYPEDQLSILINESSGSAVLGITSAEVLVVVEAPTEFEFPENFESLLERNLRNSLDIEIAVSVRILRYDSL